MKHFTKQVLALLAVLLVSSVSAWALTPPTLGERVTKANLKDGMYIAIANVQYVNARSNPLFPTPEAQGFMTTTIFDGHDWWGAGPGVIIPENFNNDYVWKVESAGTINGEEMFYFKSAMTDQYIGGTLKSVKLVDKAEALPFYATDVTYTSGYYKGASYFDAENLIRFRTPSNKAGIADYYFGPAYNYGNVSLLDGDNSTLFSMVYEVNNVTVIPSITMTRGDQLTFDEMVDGATFVMNTATKVSDNNSANWYLGTSHEVKNYWNDYYPLSLTEGIDATKVYQFENGDVVDGHQMMYVKNMATGLYLRGAMDASSPAGYVTELVSKEDATAFYPVKTVGDPFNKPAGEGSYEPTNENSIVLKVNGANLWFTPFWNYGFTYFGGAADLVGANLYKVSNVYTSALVDYVYKQNKDVIYSQTGFGAYNPTLVSAYVSHLDAAHAQIQAGTMDEATAKTTLEALQAEEATVRATITGDGYYYIVNNEKTDKAMYFGRYGTNNGLQLLWGPKNENDLRQIFKIEKATVGKWYISTVVNGQKLGIQDKDFYSIAGLDEVGAPMTIKNNEDGSVTITPDGYSTYGLDRPSYNAYHVAGNGSNPTWNLVAVDESLLAQLMTEAKCQLADAAVEAQDFYKVGVDPAKVSVEGTDAVNAYNQVVAEALALVANPAATDAEATAKKAELEAAAEAVEPYVNPVDDAIYNITNTYFRHEAFGIVDRVTTSSLDYSTLAHKNFKDDGNDPDNMAYLWHITPSADYEGWSVNQNMATKQYMSRNGYGIMDLADEQTLEALVYYDPIEGGNFNIYHAWGNLITIEKYDNNHYVVAYADNVTNPLHGYWGLNLYGYEVTITNSAKTTLPDESEVYVATVVLPQAAALPVGVKAWNTQLDATHENVLLSEYDGTVIPANTAVLITSATPGNYIFKYTTDGAGTIQTIFEGSAREDKAVTEGDQPYILTYNDEGEAVMRKAVTIRTDGTPMYISARKGYAYISGVSQSMALRFAGDATGIDAVNAADAAVYYDLQGRKVANPVKGQLYIKNGKKIIK